MNNVAISKKTPMRTAVTSALFVALTILAVLLPGIALADDATTATLPYEAGIKVFYTSMTGTIPFVISLVGIIACGAMLIFGGEISGFMRTMVFIILVVAVIVQAASVVEMLGGKKGLFGTAGVQLSPSHGEPA